MIGVFVGFSCIPLNAELNPTCHLLALLGGATIVVVSRLRVKCDDSAPRRISVLKSAPRRKKYGNHYSIPYQACNRNALTFTYLLTHSIEHTKLSRRRYPMCY